MAVSFDLFGTLVDHEQPDDPAGAVGEALAARGVAVPPDWEEAYGERHLSVPDDAEVPLPAHVGAALASRQVTFDSETVRQAVLAALDPVVEARSGATAAIAAARSAGPVAICSNCSVPEFVGLSLSRSGLDLEDFQAVVTSVGCGWRKPAPEVFTTTADRLGVAPESLVHVGDDPDADGGVEAVGGTAVLLDGRSLREVTDELHERV